MWRPNAKSVSLLKSAESIYSEYSFLLSSRQVWWELVRQEQVEFSSTSWRKVQTLLLNAARSQYFYSAEVPEVRDLPASWVLHRYVSSFHLPRTLGQANAVELWVGKGTILPFVENLVQPYSIPVTALDATDIRGLTQSIARIVQSKARRGSPRIMLLHDYGASSTESVGAVKQVLAQNLDLGLDELDAILVNVAVTPEQILHHGLVPQLEQVKRHQSFHRDEREVLDLLGMEPSQTVEVEAMRPGLLAQCITSVLLDLLDHATLADVARREAEVKEELRRSVEQ